MFKVCLFFFFPSELSYPRITLLSYPILGNLRAGQASRIQDQELV